MKEKFILYILIALINAILMSLEIIGPRILAPYFGNTAFTWTSMITVVLTSIALGYYIGGYLDEKYNNTYKTSFYMLLLSAISIFLLNLLKHKILEFYMHVSISISLKTILSSFSLFLFPSLFLSTVPVILSSCLIKDDSSQEGKKIGKIFGISTIGSLVGIFVTSFVLIPWVGTEKILFVLTLTALSGLFVLKFWNKWMFFILILFIYNTYSLYTYNYLTSIVDIDSFYQRIFIYETTHQKNGQKIKVMQLNNHINSAVYVKNPNELVYDYNTMFYNFIECKKNKKNILVLGGAAFTLPKKCAQNFENIIVDVVEIDPVIIRESKKHFSENLNGINLIENDARVYLNSTEKKYDIIVCDVFTSQYNIPDHLTTIETVKKIKKQLTDDGLVLLNIIGTLDGKYSLFPKSLKLTYEQTFNSVNLIPVETIKDSNILQNIILFASNYPSDSILSCYTDNIKKLFWNPSYTNIDILTDNYSPFSYSQSISLKE